MKRRIFTKEFRRSILDRVWAGEGVMQLAEELNINSSIIYRWVRKSRRPTVKSEVSKPVKSNGHANHDALVFLRHARDAAVVQITQDPQRFDDPVYQLAMLALREMEKR